MGVVISPDSDLGRELAKWEQHHTRFVAEGAEPGNPYRYRPFPQMVYRAQLRKGKAVCMDPAPHPHTFEKSEQYEQAVLAAESFNRGCYRIVQSEDELRQAKNEGWRESIKDALDALEQRQQAIGDAAAERAYRDRGMSDRARAEVDAAERSTEAHVVDVQPKKKRGRPAKGVTAVTE